MPTPPWFWVFLIGAIALLLWQARPKDEKEVTYIPWFAGQVEHDNVESIQVQGTEIRGVLREEAKYRTAPRREDDRWSSSSSAYTSPPTRHGGSGHGREPQGQ